MPWPPLALPARRPLWLDPRPLLAALLLARASADPWLDALKGEDGGMGPGALLNGLLLLSAARYVLYRPGPLLRGVLPLWGPFLLLGLCSLAVAPDWHAGLRLLLVQLSYAAAFALPLWLVREPGQLRRWLRLLLLASLLPAGWALADVALGRDPQGDGLFRVQGSFNHPNILAFYLLLMLTVILYLQRGALAPPAAPRWRRRLLWCYALLLAALLALTKTRSAWAGAVLIFGLYGLLAERRMLCFLLLAPAALLLDEGLRERLLDVAGGAYDPDGNLNSYAWRVLMWQSALGWMEGWHWLLGYGLESFHLYSPQFFPLEGRDNWDPHNSYVHVLFEMGLAGLLAYLWLFWRLLRRLAAGPGWRRRVILCASVLAYLLMAYSDNMLYYLSYNWYFWFFIGCALAEQGSCGSPT